MTKQEVYADKIAKLLRKAESTTPAEAEALTAKAQQLMTKYAIQEAMLEAHRDVVTDEIVQETVSLVGGTRQGQMNIIYSICNRNNVKGVYNEMPQVVDGKTYRQAIRFTMTGFKSDIERVKLLNASLQLQASSAIQAYAKSNFESWWTNSEKHRAKRDFLDGFASELGRRLSAANEAAKAEAVKEKAEAENTTEAAASDSVALVVRSRKDQVNDWFDKKYGNSLRSARSSYRRTNYGAHGAGARAGATANIGNPSVGGGHRGLNR